MKGPSATASHRSTSRTVVEEAAQAVVDAWGPGEPGGIVGVMIDGELVVTAASGLASVEHGIPWSERTPFPIASITKHMTAAAAMALEAQGALTLDDAVSAHLPEVGQPDLTLRHLLTNTSGIKDDEDLLWLAGVGDDTPSTIEEHVRAALRAEREFHPGSHCRYSNAGFRVAALVLERAAGMPFHQVMEAALFSPLGLRGTRVKATPSEVVPGLAGDYRPRGGGFERFMFQRPTTGDGGVVSTLLELLTWGEHLRTDTLPVAGLRERLTERPGLAGGSPSPYGHGLCVLDIGGQRAWMHSGGIGCSYSELAILPDAGAVVAILDNRGDARTRAMLRRLLEASGLARASGPGVGPDRVPPGVYVCGAAGLVAEVTVDDGHASPGIAMWSSPASHLLARDGETSDTVRPHGPGFELSGPQHGLFVPADERERGDPERLAGTYAISSPATTFTLEPASAGLEMRRGRGRHPSEITVLTAAAPDVWAGGELIGLRPARASDLVLNLPGAREIGAVRVS